ncbi:MAG: cyclase family protein [Saprospiraceae bacterium]|nr:cyclase family protein [Saprospiraceae bacterium]
MKAVIEIDGNRYDVDLSQPVDLSLPIAEDGPRAFYAPDPDMSPVRSGGFIGSTRAGGAVNTFDVRFNPHGNGTHTECQGHITENWDKITELDGDTHCLAGLLSVQPREINGDQVITKEEIKEKWIDTDGIRALIIRTLPNEVEKKNRKYSGQNPPYFDAEGIKYIVNEGIEHLLVDLPSVDKEEDEGKLASHKAFWQLPAPGGRENCTITELIYVPDDVGDGIYFLDIQRSAFLLDCAPSRPVIYQVEKTR